jgi:hypothetical protein
MSRLYGLLNVILAVAGVYAVSWMLGQKPAERWELPKTRTLPASAPRAADRPGPAGNLDPARQIPLDDLWKHSLFRPDRTEVVGDDEEADEQADSNQPQDMELIGIGIIGKESAAVILVRATTTRRRNVRTPQPEPKKQTRHVYRLGQTIAETGYVLKEITLTQVTLVRGADERILELEHGDRGSQQRSAQAEAAEKKAKEASPSKTNGKTATKLTPPPPPPPPMATPTTSTSGKTSTTTSADKTSREERIRRALEARRQILERRRQLQNKK